MIRLVNEHDAKPLRRLVMKYLHETYDQGGDFPPTLENAAAFVQHAIQGAREGDPCLVAQEDDGTIAGFVMARGVFFPGMETREVTLRSWGSYVLPQYRGSAYAVKLFMVVGRLAKQKGYTRILGFTHGTDYTEHGTKVVEKIAGMKEVGKVLMMDLRTLPCMVNAHLDETLQRVEDAPAPSAILPDAVPVYESPNGDGPVA